MQTHDPDPPPPPPHTAAEVADPMPAGTPSALAAAAQDPPPRRSLRADHGQFEYQGSPSVLLLTLASQNLIAHARTLASDARGEYQQMAVLFAHAACELHTEWAIGQLLNARPDKVLAALVLPADRDVMSLHVPRVRRVYRELGRDDPTKADWWEAWKASRQDRDDVAHRGALMTAAQAQNAIALADRYMAHVTEKVEAARKNPA